MSIVLRRAAAALFLLLLTAVTALPALAVNKTVNGITVDVNLPQIQRGVPFSFQIAPTGPTGFAGSYSFQLLSGTLPGGITISSSGLVSGTTCAGNGSYSPHNVRIRTVEATPVTADFTGGSSFSVNVTTTPANGCSLVVTANAPSGTAGTPYSGSVTATGGTGPDTYSVVGGSLPAGLVLDPATGAITGTPTGAGTSSFYVQATDANGSTGVTSNAISVAVAPASGVVITVSPGTLPGGTTGTAYSQTVSAAGGTGPYTFARTTGGLPAGLVLNASTGAISGTPTAAGTYNFGIRATDANADTGEQTYSVTIAGGDVLTVTPATLPAGTTGTAYSQALSATGGDGGPYTFAVTAGSLPGGLSLSSAGVLSGTPTAAGTTGFTVTATDGRGDFGTRVYSLVIAGGDVLTVNPATLPGGTTGTAYSQTVTASGGAGAPYTFSVSAGSLPGGLVLSSAGALTGTPTAAGSYSFTVRAQDANGDFGTRAYTLVIAAGNVLTVSPATLPNGTTGAAYSQALSATGGTGGPYTFTVTAGSLPGGLALSSAGVLSGTPTAAGTAGFTVTATDANGDFGTRTYSLVIAAGNVLTVNPATLPNGTNGTAYAQSVSATGGLGAPYTYSMSASSLPTGLTLDPATGAIAGTPTAVGAFAFTIRAQDANGDFGTRAYSVSIAGGNILAVAPSSLPGGTSGAAYSQTVSATGGVAPYAFAVSAGSLPGGLVLSASGSLSGTPVAAGTYGFTITATDADGNFGSRAYSITVAPSNLLTLNPASLPGGTNGTAYSQTVTATGGAGAPYAYSVSAGTLPPGLALDGASGAVAGTPTTAGTYAFTVRAQDANGDFGSRAYTVAIAGAASVSITTASLPNATNRSAYSATVLSSGGTAPYTYSVASGALPAGLSLSPAGAITGTPSVAGTYTITIRSVDANGNFGSRSFTLVVAGAPVLTVAPATLPGGTNGVAYSQVVTASGGTAPYGYAVAGTLPTGLSLDASTGALTGTPTVAGSFSFSITATDANGDYGARAHVVTVVGAATLAVNPATLPGATNGSAYSQVLTATNGTAPYAFSLTSGTLPTGLSLSPTGVISGTPTVAGSYTFTVQVVDANGNFGTRTYTVNSAGAGTLTVNPSTLPGATNGSAYSQTLTAANGTAPYTFSLTAGTLPTGLSLSSTGAITGTPTVAGSYTFTVQAIDANGNFGTRTYTVASAGAATLTVSPATLPAGNARTPYSQAFSATGGTAPYTYSVGSGNLPPGLSLTPGGQLAGTPTTPGSYTFTVRGVDANGNFGVRTVTLVIDRSIRPDPTQDPGVVETVNQQLGAARRAGETQMAHVFRRLESPSGCVTEDDADSSCDDRLQAWVAGTSERQYGGSGKSSLTAMTAGADTRLGDSARVGAAIGTGSDDVTGRLGGRTDADSRAAMLYGRWQVGGGLYVDAVFGRSWLEMDSRRTIAGTTTAATGRREGEADFGAIGLAGELRHGAAGLVPYVRYEATRTTLEGYAEASASELALQYGRLEQSGSALVAGAQAYYGLQFGWGRLTPTARVELRDRRIDGTHQSMWYADRGDVVYRLPLAGFDGRAVTMSLGLEAAIHGLRLRLEYGTAGSALKTNDGQSIQVQVRGEF